MRSGRKILLAISLSFFVCSCSPYHYSDTSYGYGTFWNYHLFEGTSQDIENLIEVVSKTSIACDNTTSSYSKGIGEINKNGKAIVENWLLEELKLGVELSEKTSGYFSIFSGGLTDLWLENLEKGKLPEPSKIDAEVALISQTRLVFNGNEVTKIGDAKLDLGGIGKGYCLELLKGELSKKNLTKYWISAGGSSISLGENPSMKEGKTKVEFEDLPDKYTFAKNMSLSTSSAHKQLYEIEGKEYSHIVNPFSGSAEVTIDAVIAFGENAAVLDALTTAVYLQGIDAAKEYEKEFDIRFLLVDDEKVMYSSDGIELEG